RLLPPPSHPTSGLVAAAVIAAGARQSGASDTITISIAVPNTAPVAAYGTKQFHRPKIAHAQINPNGGVVGKNPVPVE
ncbi:hypothetical protein RA272_28580, partial [Pseudomonas syringae pv. tagetis]